MSQEQSTSSSGSVRSLPSGKLQNLKKLFEEKDAQASVATVFGASPPKAAGGRGRPISAPAQPGRPASTGAQPDRPVSTATQPKSIPTSSTSQPKPAPRHGSPARNKPARGIKLNISITPWQQVYHHKMKMIERKRDGEREGGKLKHSCIMHTPQ